MASLRLVRATLTRLAVGAVVWCLAGPTLLAQDVRVAAAAKARDQQALKALIAARADVNAAQPDGSTALHWAVHWNDLEAARALVGAGANVNAADAHGVTPLYLAAENASATMGELLLEAGANAKAARPGGETVLMRAAWTGSAPLVTLLMAAGADVEAREARRGQTAVMWAAAQKHPAVVRVLIGHGANVRTRSTSGFTPLLFAAREGDVESIRALLGAGADPNEAVPNGINALVLAAFRGHVDAALALLEGGANPNATPTGFTALHWAAGSWETELSGARGIVVPPDHEWARIGGITGPDKMRFIAALLARGADINQRLTQPPQRIGFTRGGSEGRSLVGATAFLLAAAAADVETMRQLLQAGADSTLTTTQGTTPLMFAAGLGRIKFESLVTSEGARQAVTFLLEQGADINAANTAGETALHGAAAYRDDALVELLVAKGADVHATNKKGQTPLVVAETTLVYLGEARTERSSTGDLLRKLGATR